MRESVIDVLFYLFDIILEQDDDDETNLTELAASLSGAGFSDEDIERAISWFCDFSHNVDKTPVVKMGALRVFSSLETSFINEDCQDFLHGLLRVGVLNSGLLETVIEQALALEEPIDIETLRWIVLMVVINTAKQEDAALSIWRSHWLYPDDKQKIQ